METTHTSNTFELIWSAVYLCHLTDLSLKLIVFAVMFLNEIHSKILKSALMFLEMQESSSRLSQQPSCRDELTSGSDVCIVFIWHGWKTMENNMWWYSWIGQFITAILSVDEVNWLYVFIGEHSTVSRLKSMRYWNRYTSMAGWLNHFFGHTCLPDSYVSVKCMSLPISRDLAQTKASCIFISCLYSV